jgi:hypothetical protein
MRFTVAGLSHSTVAVFSSGLPSTAFTPSSSLNSSLIALTQCSQDILGIENVCFSMATFTSLFQALFRFIETAAVTRSGNSISYNKIGRMQIMDSRGRTHTRSRDDGHGIAPRFSPSGGRGALYCRIAVLEPKLRAHSLSTKRWGTPIAETDLFGLTAPCIFAIKPPQYQCIRYRPIRLNMVPPWIRVIESG